MASLWRAGSERDCPHAIDGNSALRRLQSAGAAGVAVTKGASWEGSSVPTLAILLLIALWPPGGAGKPGPARVQPDTNPPGSHSVRQEEPFAPRPRRPETYDILQSFVIDPGTYRVVEEVYEGDFPDDFRSASVTLSGDGVVGAFVVKDSAGKILLKGCYEADPGLKCTIDVTATAEPVQFPPFSKVGDQAKGQFGRVRAYLSIMLAGPGLGRVTDWTSPLLHQKGSRHLLLVLKNDAYRRRPKP